MKKISLGVVLFILLLSCTGCFSYEKAEKAAEDSQAIAPTQKDVPAKESVPLQELESVDVATPQEQKVEIKQAIPEEPPTTKEPEVPTYYLGDTFQLGDLKYTVHDYAMTKTLGNEYLAETADGVFIIFDVTIENVGRETINFMASNVFAIMNDKQQFYKPTSKGMVFVDDVLDFCELQPSLPKRGKIIFETPAELKGLLVVREFSDLSILTPSNNFVIVSWKTPTPTPVQISGQTTANVVEKGELTVTAQSDVCQSLFPNCPKGTIAVANMGKKYYPCDCVRDKNIDKTGLIECLSEINLDRAVNLLGYANANECIR